ncbi:glycosyltransferase family 39 protein [Candidatus Sumerlaeota bacterium]|nr:glycosyltransferase family 39 protein [Candidatus Sumerlaeota bacterium]
MEESSEKTERTAPCSGDDSSLSVSHNFLSSSSETWTLKKGDIVFLLLLFFLTQAFVLLSCLDYGLSWDEAYYYEPSRSAARWLSDLFLLRNRPFSRESIDQVWSEIRELPSVVKISLGISHAMFSPFLGPLVSLRIPSALAFSLTLVLIYILMLKSFGRGAAAFSVSAYALMPRIFGHAHIAASETITVFMHMAVMYCFLKGMERPRWSVALGVVFGLALNTKINCLFLPMILLPWAHLYHRKKYGNNFFSMAFLSPLVMILTWPWLWHDTFRRLLEYIAFFIAHQFTAVFYFGQKYNYGSTLAPWHYPFILAVLTIPPLFLFFILTGVAGALQFLRKNPVGALFLWGALFTLTLSAAPSSPKYDGVRLFIPAFLFLALLAGVGMVFLQKNLPVFLGAFFAGFRTTGNSDFRISEKWNRIFPIVSIALVLTTGIFSIGISHPFPLSYFNIFIGGIRGAYKKGMETTYWGEAVNSRVLDVLNELPTSSRIKTLALHDEVFNLLQDWGKIRRDLQINPSDPPYDYHLLLVRKGFFARPEWCLYLSWNRLRVFDHRGAPLVILFQTGERFENSWQTFSVPVREGIKR